MASFSLPAWMQPLMHREPAPASGEPDAADLGTELGLEASLPGQASSWLMPHGADGGHHAETQPAPLDFKPAL